MSDAELIIKQLEALLVKLIEANTRLSAENKHVNVAFLGSEITRWKEKCDARLALFDGNHTRAQGKLVDGMKALEDRTKQAVAGLHKRIKELESQDTDRTLAQGRIMESLEQHRDRIKALEAVEAEPATEKAS